MREFIVTEEDIRLLSGELPSNRAQFARVWQLNNGEGLPEIVRCSDCEYFDTRKCKSQWPFCVDGYCFWGKRREDA